MKRPILLLTLFVVSVLMLFSRSPSVTSQDVTFTVTVFLPVVRLDRATPTATAIVPPTVTVAPADVQITYIEYNPSGDDVQGEYVRIENFGGVGADMTGWMLSDAANHDYIFPTFTLSPGAVVRVWVKSGINTSTSLYWGLGNAVWNNTGDTAYLRDDQGGLVDIYSY